MTPGQSAPSRRRVTVGAKVAAVMMALVGSMLAVSLLSLYSLSRAASSTDAIETGLVHVEAADELTEALNDGYTNALLHLADADPQSRNARSARVTSVLIPRVQGAIERFVALEADHSLEHSAELEAVRAGWRRYLELWRSGSYDAAAAGDAGVPAAVIAARTDQIFTPVIDAVRAIASDEAVQATQAGERAHASEQAARRLALVALACSAAIALAGGVALRRNVVNRVVTYSRFAVAAASGERPQPLEVRGDDELSQLGRILNDLVHRQEQARLFDDAQARFSAIMQHSDDEDEAHDLVKRHVERSIPGTTVTVLNRNNSADRLEATTAIRPDSPLSERLVEVEPRSCLAVRFAQRHVEGGDASDLIDCAVCGNLGRNATCEPLLVSGEVIGSVLVQHDGTLADDQERRIRDTVKLASPVLGNLRSLALAEFRANNDALTGVANKRAADDTLKRLTAIASRTLTPLAVILLDLDNFKQLNDLYGHDKGDEALAAAGAAMKGALRESDFVGRYGGEEFLVVLPATDTAGAQRVAEDLRTAITSITVHGVERGLSASFGVAVMPDDAGDAGTLLRMADRALYAAKANGRNRVEMAGRAHVLPSGDLPR